VIDLSISTKKMLEVKTDCFVFFLEDGFAFSKELKEVANTYFPRLKQYMEDKAFTGKANSSLVIPVSTEKKVVTLIFIGVGSAKKGKKIDIENLRRALGLLIRLAEKNKFASFVAKMPAAKLFGVTDEYLAKQCCSILHMANYHFDTFITDQDKRLAHDFSITLVVDKKEKKAFDTGIKEGKVIAQAVNSARHWVDLPPADLTPVQLADDAKKIAKKHGFKITIFDEKKVNELGMGGLAAVSEGSDRDCRLVIMEYKAKKKNAPTVAFVGKGITFDSGGLSLKPSGHMETMKEDMAGAAAVIASMDALGYLKPKINVLCVAALSENLPSGKATKPGDIIRFYNGKTAEVKNTDAEGRLVLADALSYTVKHYKPDAIIDLATLTGACQYALGSFFCGLMSKHDDFVKKVEHASKLSGDRVWPLPFDDDYKPAIKSTVADISNTGDRRYMAGTITAGFFLRNFVGDTPWVHLDIAGTAFNVPAISYFRDGATGFGVRLLIDLALHWN